MCHHTCPCIIMNINHSGQVSKKGQEKDLVISVQLFTVDKG